MQYGHCVVNATASVSSSFVLAGIAPSLNAASSNARNPAIPSGANSLSVLIFFRFAMSYTAGLLAWVGWRSVRVQVADQAPDELRRVQQPADLGQEPRPGG